MPQRPYFHIHIGGGQRGGRQHTFVSETFAKKGQRVKVMTKDPNHPKFSDASISSKWAAFYLSKHDWVGAATKISEITGKKAVYIPGNSQYAPRITVMEGVP